MFDGGQMALAHDKDCKITDMTYPEPCFSCSSVFAGQFLVHPEEGGDNL